MSNNDTTPIIQITNITYLYPNNTIGLKQLSLQIYKGEFVVIAGSNGSGKTTLLRHFNGLLQPQKGQVRVCNMDVKTHHFQIKQHVGMIFQNPDTQIIGETVYDEVAFGPENLCLDRDIINTRVHHAIQDVGLTHVINQAPYTLSGGEKRRLAIAGILAMQSDIIVFDEPFSELDYTGVKQILNQMVRLHQKGHTLIVTTHDIEKIYSHASRMIIMADGQIQKDGPPQALLIDLEKFGIREPCGSRYGKTIESWLT